MFKWSRRRAAVVMVVATLGAVLAVPAQAEAAACVFRHDTRPASRNWPGGLSSLVGSRIDTGRHTCFERIVIRMSGTGSMPGYRVSYETDPVTLSPSDMKVFIRGKATLVIRTGVWMPDMEGHGYSGKRQFFPTNVSKIKELRQIENFESVTQWAVGLDRKRPFGVTTLSNPPRLVVDIGTS
jgi:hypothetical protein